MLYRVQNPKEMLVFTTIHMDSWNWDYSVSQITDQILAETRVLLTQKLSIENCQKLYIKHSFPISYLMGWVTKLQMKVRLRHSFLKNIFLYLFIKFIQKIFVELFFYSKQPEILYRPRQTLFLLLERLCSGKWGRG